MWVWTIKLHYGPCASKRSTVFFKRVVRHSTCFKNVLQSLAVRHQFLMAHHLYTCNFSKSPLDVSNVSTLPIDILKEDITFAIKQRYPDLNVVCLTKKCYLQWTEIQEWNDPCTWLTGRTTWICWNNPDDCCQGCTAFHCKKAECFVLGTLQSICNHNWSDRSISIGWIHSWEKLWLITLKRWHI